MYLFSGRFGLKILGIKKEVFCKTSFDVAGARLELTTFGLWAQRATNCSTPRYNWECKDARFFQKKQVSL